MKDMAELLAGMEEQAGALSTDDFLLGRSRSDRN